jgi:hypothetical protein
LAIHDGVPPKKSNISIIGHDGFMLEGKENSDALNSHFVSVAMNVTSNLNCLLDCSTASHSVMNDFTLSATDEEEVREVILALKNTSAMGADGIRVNTLKYCIDEVCRHIVDIINRSFIENKVPTGMKIAKVIPIFKGGSPTDPNNFRPISILPVLSKVLEKIVQRRLLTFLRLNYELFARQYGFVEKSNTVCALFDMIARIQESLDKGFRTSGLFIDLAKAFDVVDHEFLLKKLWVLGIRHGSNIWFRSYLENRMQHVYCNLELSDNLMNPRGVPQGSILGPLLFLLFIDDIKELVLLGNLQLFADDIAIIYSNMNWEEIESAMNSDLEKIRTWMTRNKLAVNARKSNFITFGNTETPDLNIKFGDDSLNFVPKVKYLGVLIDQRLNFGEHVDFIVKKCSAIVGILFKLRNVLPPSVRKIIYFSLIHSHISYACEIWGHTSDYYIEKLFIMQKKAVKAMCGQSYRSHSFQIFCQNSILPLRLLISYQSCIFIHNSINSYIHSNLPLLANSNFHNYDTRQRRDLHYDRNNTVRHGSHSMIHCCRKFYNDRSLVPNGIKDLCKIPFKIKLKNCFKSSFLNVPPTLN